MPNYSSLRVLAIDPTTKGFGFVVMEGPDLLVDWGVRSAGGEEKNSACLKLTSDLIDRYRPAAIAVEDFRKKSCRRPERVRNLIAEVAQSGTLRKIKIRRFTRSQVREAFTAEKIGNKEQIAAEIARRLPELVPRLPRHRYPWMSEDFRMAIFDAASLALTFFHFEAHKRKNVLLDLGITTNHAQQ